MTHSSEHQSHDLARSIRQTMVREARTNELHLASLRIGLASVVSVVELYWAATVPLVPFVDRVPIFLYLGLAVGTWQALRRGYWAPWLAVALPAVDFALVASRLDLVYRVHPLEMLRAEMAMATVLGCLMVIVMTTALRLSRPAVVTSTGLALLIYARFAVLSEMQVADALVQASTLVATGATAWVLTSVVARAVRSEVERVTLSRFLHPSVLEGAHDPLALLTKAKQTDATILFTDIRGFTRWAETRDPLMVLHVLNRIQGEIARCVEEHHGTVDKFMGDGMLAVFGAPGALPDHAEHAVAAVRSIRERVEPLLRDADGAVLSIGYGVHSGTVVAGCLGSGSRLEFTVLGDAVNTASRLEALTKTTGESVIVSGETVALLSDRSGLRRMAPVTLRGRDCAVEVWALEEATRPRSAVAG